MNHKRKSKRIRLMKIRMCPFGCCFQLKCRKPKISEIRIIDSKPINYDEDNSDNV